MNVQKAVRSALENIGVPVSFLKNTDNPKPSTYVTFFEVNGTPTEYMDDKYHKTAITVQVDIWTTYGNSLFTLQKDIIAAMKLENFRLSFIGNDMYEEETNMVHKPLEFKILDNEVR